MQQQNFLWLPTNITSGPCVNLQGKIPAYDNQSNRWIGCANSQKYICLPIPRPYTDAELEKIGELVVATFEKQFQGWWVSDYAQSLRAIHVAAVAVAISKFEKSITTC